jgi:ankyrin repeat protein
LKNQRHPINSNLPHHERIEDDKFRRAVDLIDAGDVLADARRLLPDANSNDRHLALTLAADHGHAEIVRLLLDAGEDPNRYNPVGGHSHATPLHQAAAAGHTAVVHLLVARGGRLDIKDILWQATPADWANHAGQKEIEAYLRKKAKHEI